MGNRCGNNYSFSIDKIKKNVFIILAGGRSTRFNQELVDQEFVNKQIYKIGETTPIEMILKQIIDLMDDIIIVTNSQCYEQIRIFSSDKIHVVTNNLDNRNESIKCGINYMSQFIVKKDFKYNLFIHDSARPYILKEHIEEIIKMSRSYLHIQYGMNLYNGLAKNKINKFYSVDRNKYFELCTPTCTEYELYKYVFFTYILSKKHHEVIDVLNKMSISYLLLNLDIKYLKKITFRSDLIY